jgi:hypothetical protein
MGGIAKLTIVPLTCALAVGACVLPDVNAPASPRVEVLETPGPYGTEAAQVLEHPAVAPRLRALLGADWKTTTPAGLSAPIPAFFGRSSAPRALRAERAEWVAVNGCAPAACASRRGLVIIETGGERLFVRIDDGGFTRDYGFGPGMVSLSQQDAAFIDAARRALAARERSG